MRFTAEIIIVAILIVNSARCYKCASSHTVSEKESQRVTAGRSECELDLANES